MNSVAESIPARFARIAALHARRVAISAPDVKWTYAELDQRSSALAGRISEHGSDSAKPIALLMEHGAPLIAAVLGVLRSGRLYLSLDSHDPPARLTTVLEDAQPGLLLADRENVPQARSLGIAGLRIMEAAQDALVGWGSHTLPEISPAAGAWLMYTSGSTGSPKGVWQNHASTIHHAKVYAELIQLSPDDRLSLLTSTSLAASATHLFAALLHGATLCLFPLRAQGVERLSLWLPKQPISVYHSVPTVFRHLMRSAGHPRCWDSLRLIRLGGEPALFRDVELYQRHCPAHCQLLHALSSTETGLISAFLIEKRTQLPNQRVPVGRAMRGVELLLLDGQGQRVGGRHDGRIAVRSAHLAQGYWQQPGATENAFRTDPLDPQSRLFITGDVGRFLPDGNLEHLGRVDQQVKIRGRRVELGEVETALHATDQVKEVTVTAAEDETGERRLVAYVVPQSGAVTTPQALRRLLMHLPEHLMPTGFVFLDRLPLTAGGKIDRRALPPWSARCGDSEGRFLAPRKGIEQSLAQVWEAVLGVSPIGRRDDFFDLGGGSLQSVRVLAYLQERFNVTLSPSALVEHSTIETLAELVARHALKMSSRPLVVLRASKVGRPLFLVHSGEGDVALYGQLARRLGDRSVYGFQCPGLDGECEPLMGIVSAARLYLQEVLAHDPTGPYLLGGARMGALVAFEMAQQLVRQRKTVTLVALFDFCPPRPRQVFDPVIEMFTRARDGLRAKGWAVIRAVGRKHRARWLANYREFVARMNCHSRHDYRMHFYPGTITLFMTADRMGPQHRLLSRYARDVRVITLPGPVAGLLTAPVVDELARELQKCLDQAESPNRP